MIIAQAGRGPTGAEVLDGISRTIREGHDMFNVGPIVTIIVGLIVMAAALWLYRWARRQNARAVKLNFFNEIADTIGLRAGDRALLIDIARYEGLRTPVTLMVCSSTLSHHAESYSRNLSRRRCRAVSTRVESMQTKLFA